jgi:hypothetical protein
MAVTQDDGTTSLGQLLVGVSPDLTTPNRPSGPRERRADPWGGTMSRSRRHEVIEERGTVFRADGFRADAGHGGEVLRQWHALARLRLTFCSSPASGHGVGCGGRPRPAYAVTSRSS